MKKRKEKQTVPPNVPTLQIRGKWDALKKGCGEGVWAWTGQEGHRLLLELSQKGLAWSDGAKQQRHRALPGDCKPSCTQEMCYSPTQLSVTQLQWAVISQNALRGSFGH